MTKFTGNNSKEIVRRMIREAVRSRMGLMTEGETTTSGDYEVALSGTNLDDITVSWKAPTDEIVIELTVATPDETTTKTWKKEEKPREDIPRIFQLKGWAEAPGLCTVSLTFGTWDGSAVTEIKAVTSDITLDAAPAPVADTTPAPAAAPAAADVAAPVADPDVAVTAEAEPQTYAKSMSIQDKIRTSAQAIQAEFDDVYAAGIQLSDVIFNNPYDYHTWVENTDSSRAQFNLNDFSTGEGYTDEYTYFALVNNESQKPIAFVVASDPKADGHFSTGRFIGPTSQRRSLKNAFCVLYHRATGEVHESCSDNGPGSENDKYGTGGKSGGKSGGGGGGGGEDSKGTGGGSTRTGSKSLSTTTRGTQIIRGRGNAERRGLANYALERVSMGGRRFYSRSKSRYDAMGPGESPTPDILKLGQKENGLNPITLVVTFKKPVQIDPSKVITSKDGSQTISGQLTTLSPNRTANDIASIGFFYGKSAANLRELARVGTPRSPGSPTKRLTAQNDPTAFAAAAEWIFSHPEQFDLAEDVEFSSSEKAQEPSLRSSDSTGAGAIPAEQSGMTMGESVSRRSLLDLYRF